MDRIDDCTNPEQVKRELVSIFGLDDNKESARNAILLDLYYYNIQFCRDNKYSKEQTSTLFSIVKSVHAMCTETPFENLEHCFNYLKELVLCHAVKRPPFSIDIFSANEVRKITEYVTKTYFRHYKMYKYVFTPLVRLDLSISYSGMPMTPPASEAGDASPEETDAKPEGNEITEAGDGTDEAEPKSDVSPQEDAPDAQEPAAVTKLRSLIKEELNKEIKTLKQSFEEQLKSSEEMLSKKISAAEGSQEKGGKGSAKGRKK